MHEHAQNFDFEENRAGESGRGQEVKVELLEKRPGFRQ